MVLSCGPLFLPPVGLLERSWKPPGPQKSNWGTALGRPEAAEETGFSMPGGQITSQKGAREGSKNWPKTGPRLKTAKP